MRQREIEQQERLLWSAGGLNGAELLMLFRGAYASSEHNLYAAQIEQTTDGKVSRIFAPANTGGAIGARQKQAKTFFIFFIFPIDTRSGNMVQLRQHWERSGLRA